MNRPFTTLSFQAKTDILFLLAKKTYLRLEKKKKQTCLCL